jgi:hypothetical protein
MGLAKHIYPEHKTKQPQINIDTIIIPVVIGDKHPLVGKHGDTIGWCTEIITRMGDSIVKREITYIYE